MFSLENHEICDVAIYGLYQTFISQLLIVNDQRLFFFKHCVKCVRIRSYSGPYFLTFGLNTEKYSVSLRIQSECAKMRKRITPNTDTFHAVTLTQIFLKSKEKATLMRLFS